MSRSFLLGVLIVVVRTVVQGMDPDVIGTSDTFETAAVNFAAGWELWASAPEAPKEARTASTVRADIIFFMGSSLYKACFSGSSSTVFWVLFTFLDFVSFLGVAGPHTGSAPAHSVGFHGTLYVYLRVRPSRKDWVSGLSVRGKISVKSQNNRGKKGSGLGRYANLCRGSEKLACLLHASRSCSIWT